jgi:sporulation integral membrane protein YtvI
MPFLLAYAMSRPLSFLVKKIRSKVKLPVNLLSFIVVIVFIGIFITGISFAAYKGIMALRGISAFLSAIAQNIQSFTASASLIQLNLPWQEDPIALSDVLFQFYDIFIGTISSLTDSVLNFVVSVVKTIPSVALFMFFMFLSLYFFTKDRDRISLLIKKNFEKIKSPLFHHIKSSSIGTIKNYFKAQLILISITFTISVVGLTILGIPFSPLIALVVALVDLIPMVGPAIIYMPWIILIALMSEYSTAIVLLIIYLTTTLTRQIIEPKIVSSKIGTHPLIMLFSMYTCYRFVGIPGFIIGPIIVMTSLVLIKSYNATTKIDEH